MIEIDCPECEGTGFVECDDCGGDGMNDQGDNCQACAGNGHTDEVCDFCDGTGEVEEDDEVEEEFED